MATFEENLRPLRKARGLTQEKAAKKLGLYRSTLANYETGARVPDYDTAIKICRFYHVPFDYFADESVPIEEVTIEDVADRAKELGVNLTQLSAASGISYNTLRQALRGGENKGHAYVSEDTIRRLMETLEDFDFTVFPNYRKPVSEEGEE